MELKKDLEFLKHNITKRETEILIKVYLWMLQNYKNKKIKEITKEEEIYINKSIENSLIFLEEGKYKISEDDIPVIYSLIRLMILYKTNKDIKGIINYFFYNYKDFKNAEDNIYKIIQKVTIKEVTDENSSETIEVEICYDGKLIEYNQTLKNRYYQNKLKKLGIEDIDKKTVKEIIQDLTEKGTKILEKNNKYIKLQKRLKEICFFSGIKYGGSLNFVIRKDLEKEFDEEVMLFLVNLQQKILMEYIYKKLKIKLMEKYDKDLKEIIDKIQKYIIKIMLMNSKREKQSLFEKLKTVIEKTDSNLKKMKEEKYVEILKIEAMESIYLKRKEQVYKYINEILNAFNIID